MNIGAGGLKEDLKDVKWINFSGPLYELNIETIMVDQERIDVSLNDDLENRVPYLDSGSPSVLLAYNLYDKVYREFTQFCNRHEKCPGRRLQSQLSECWVKPDDLPEPNFFLAFPSIRFEIAHDLEIVWAPKEYLSGFNGEQPSLYCLGFKKSFKTILGATFMKDQNIIFDTENKKLGFQYKTCRPPISEEEHDKVMNEIAFHQELKDEKNHVELEEKDDDSLWRTAFAVLATIIVTAIAMYVCYRRRMLDRTKIMLDGAVELQEREDDYDFNSYSRSVDQHSSMFFKMISVTSSTFLLSFVSPLCQTVIFCFSV
eukprot:CAMPEP_0114983856 /NCGR_PEP_ID=MMETSP0216-20121206/6939_1 /TAXON_ID=223996 /ORGANISM="Protocruzia adherens, Strain Boccale" /LENGTH=314 /DNA_ID=CAMNT_0002345899 /DNA_START=658 /DNA_END=1598 /DNA_ORIENTATION=-